MAGGTKGGGKGSRSLIDVDSRNPLDGLSVSVGARDFHETKLNFFTGEQIREIASIEITEPDVFDDLGGILPHGLHDLRMGGWRDYEDTPCPTCKLSLNQGCVGHYGRIRLPEPMFNPFLFGNLHKLLKTCCSNCNKLRMAEAEKLNLLQKFKWLSFGELPPDRVYESRGPGHIEREVDAGNGLEGEAEDGWRLRVEDHTGITEIMPAVGGLGAVLATPEAALLGHQVRKEQWPAKSSDEHRQFASSLKSQIQTCDEKQRKKKDRRLQKMESDPNVWPRQQGTAEFNAALLECYRKLFRFFETNQPVGKCANCGEPASRWRKDGASRLFVKKKDKNTGELVENLAIPRVVRDMLAGVWGGPDAELIRYLFPGAENEKVFFMQDLLVTPNQFRAPRKAQTGGDSWQLDHETKCLKEILAACGDLKKAVMGGADKGGEEGRDMKNSAPAATTKALLGKKKKLQLNAGEEDLSFNNDGLLPNASNAALADALAVNGGIGEDDLAGSGGAPATASPAEILVASDTTLAKAFVTLQERVNVYLDASKGATKAELESKGIRQKIERKQGLFRMKMMGKRVNFAGRSVISPEPNVETNEIGVPLFMCKTLGVPEPVWEGNREHCKRLVLNGSSLYPGASHLFKPVQNSSRYDVIDLGAVSAEQRTMYMHYLDKNDPEKPYIVYRNLIDGDPVLMNRQPTLHKPGIMCQRVKVLHKESTLRFHYANCNTYNADFDGDEMNMHAPQDVQGRVEALRIAEADRQYIVPTSGKPLRGIIQDHIAGAVLMMARDTFFDKQDLCQLLYRGLRSQMEKRETQHVVRIPDLNELMRGIECSYANQAQEITEGVKTRSSVVFTTKPTPYRPLQIDPPAILRPVPKWTGKQAFSILLKNLITIHEGKQQVFHENKPKTPGDMWNGKFDGNKEEGKIIIRNSELLTGVLDKSEFGASAGGLTHLCYEVFGPKMAGAVLSCFARVFTAYLQMRGFTCAMIDTLVEKPAEVMRKSLVAETMKKGFQVIDQFIEDHLTVIPEEKKLEVRQLENTLGRNLWREYCASRRLGVLGPELGDRDLELAQEGRKDGAATTAGATTKKKRKVAFADDAADGGRGDDHPAATAATAKSGSRLHTSSMTGYATAPNNLVSSQGSSSPSAARRHYVKEYLEKDGATFAALRQSGTVPTRRQLRLKQILAEEPILMDMIEGRVMELTQKDWGKTIDTVLPAGQRLKFPHNSFATMIYTGAKGSKINHSQIGCLLGQQCLEGRRVPLLPTMRTLPSYAPYDLAARAGGYVTDRFLTGVRPQEFYFHCMAGREGLVDTTVKTSRSGYLQRCLVKHLETCVVAYDGTVRDTSDNSIIQFLYGEDGIDVTKSCYLEKFKQLRLNMCSDKSARRRVQKRISHLRKFGTVDLELAKKYFAIRDEVKDLCPRRIAVNGGSKKKKAVDHVLGFDTDAACKRLRELGAEWNARFGEHNLDKYNTAVRLADIEQNIKNTRHWHPYDTILPPAQNLFYPKQHLGAVSEKFHDLLREFVESCEWTDASEKQDFIDFCHLKYQNCLVDEGEGVGVLAAQGMGEPSTQMTLNTFHLAGHGGANVTLGIPRLREIVQTASRNIMTPLCRLKVLADENGSTNVDDKMFFAQKVALRYSRTPLLDLVKEYRVTEKGRQIGGHFVRTYVLELDFVDLSEIQKKFPHLDTLQKVNAFLDPAHAEGGGNAFNCFVSRFKREVDKYIKAAAKNRSREAAKSKKESRNELMRDVAGGASGVLEFGGVGNGEEDPGVNANAGGGDNSKKENKGEEEIESAEQKFDIQGDKKKNAKLSKLKLKRTGAMKKGEASDVDDEESNSESSNESSDSESDEKNKGPSEEPMTDSDDETPGAGAGGKKAAGANRNIKGNKQGGKLASTAEKKKESSSDDSSSASGSESDSYAAKRRKLGGNTAAKGTKQKVLDRKVAVRNLQQHAAKLKDEEQKEKLLEAFETVLKSANLSPQKVLRTLLGNDGEKNESMIDAMSFATLKSTLLAKKKLLSKKSTGLSKKQAEQLVTLLKTTDRCSDLGSSADTKTKAAEIAAQNNEKSIVGRWLNNVEADQTTLDCLTTFHTFDREWDGNTWNFRLDVPSACCPCKILLSEIVKKLCEELYAQDQRAKNIVKVNVLNEGDEVTIETEGVNVEAMWSLPDELGCGSLDYANLYTNCIGTTLDYYGTEAARNGIVREIRNVFGHYGIEVNFRHLYLIADYMTSQGSYRAFSRRGMQDIASPFLQMTYETSMTFANQAALEGMTDSIKSASASIIVGKLPYVGTGCFDVMHDLMQPQTLPRGQEDVELGKKARGWYVEEDENFGSDIDDDEEDPVVGVSTKGGGRSSRGGRQSEHVELHAGEGLAEDDEDYEEEKACETVDEIINDQLGGSCGDEEESDEGDILGTGGR
eukprot:g14482.t1